MSRKFVYDYYDIEIFEDAGTEEERIDLAFEEARDRSHLYAIPCEWSVIRIDGSKIRVRRTRYKNERKD